VEIIGGTISYLHHDDGGHLAMVACLAICRVGRKEITPAIGSILG
jgi:hypothetical protein